MSPTETMRCPMCRALVTPDAEWCGQCFTSLRRRPAERVATPIEDDRVVNDEVAEDMLVGDVSEAVRRMSAEFDSVSASLAPHQGATLEDHAVDPSMVDHPRLRVPGPGDSLQGGFAPPRQKVRVEGAGMGRPTWTCPACDEHNPLDLDICRVCGTAFRKLLEEPEVVPDIAPSAALVRSLILPGVGHIAVGKVAEGVARAVLFLWTIGTAVFVLSSRSSTVGGLGPMAPMAVMFILAGLAVYALSAVDAYRAADRQPPVLSTRFLLYGSAALVVLSVLSLGLLIMRLT